MVLKTEVGDATRGKLKEIIDYSHIDSNASKCSNPEYFHDIEGQTIYKNHT